MSKKTQLVTIKQANVSCFYDSSEIANFSPDMLSARYWQENNAVTGTAQGRGTTWFVQHGNNAQAKQWVLRHYYRGGLIGKIITDSYWFSSLQATRAAKEFALLAHMQTLTLPAPKPIAYRVIRHGLLYRADLLSSRIENAQDLVAVLSQRKISNNLWQKIGATIKRFHDENIYHHDLNAHNILLNAQEEVFLIDFDRGEVRASNQAQWQKSNMARLQRSFLKEAKQLPNFHWQPNHWRLLLTGYLSH